MKPFQMSCFDDGAISVLDEAEVEALMREPTEAECQAYRTREFKLTLIIGCQHGHCTCKQFFAAWGRDEAVLSRYLPRRFCPGPAPGVSHSREFEMIEVARRVHKNPSYRPELPRDEL